MSVFDWNPYLVGGGTRPDAVSGLDQQFQSSLSQMIADAPPEIQATLRLTSGFRSDDVQARLWADALKKYGSPEAARKWVAPPGKSQHNHGSAADLKYLDDAAKAYVHANAGKYGLAFPLSNEPWHIEPVGARAGSTQPAGASGPASTPRNSPTNAVAAAAQRERPNALERFANMPRMSPVQLDAGAFRNAMQRFV